MTKILLIIWMTFSITTNSLFAQDPTLLKAKQPAPYDGLLFSQEKAEEVKTKLIEGDQMKLLNDSLLKSISIYKDNDSIYTQKVNLLQQQNDSLAKSLYDERSSNFWRSVLFMGLGIVVTGLAVYGAAQINK
jgi:hypothetical protein